MVLAKVIGRVVSTIKHSSFHARITFVVQPVNSRGEPLGETFLCFDNVQSGLGDLVLVLREGTGCRQIAGVSNAPLRSMIVGVVDRVDCIS